MSNAALIIVDVQNDYLPPHGALAVPSGDEVIAPIQQMLDPGKWQWKCVVATQDYHPKGHISFASTHGVEPFTPKSVTDANGKTYEQMLWPDHCVIGSKGAEIEKALRATFEPWKDKMKVARKACHRCVEQYSGFDGYITEATDPAEPPEESSAVWSGRPPIDGEMTKYLQGQGVQRVVVTGLASEFCVNFTSLAAIEAGFKALVVGPAARGIKDEDTRKAYDAIKRAGGEVVEQNASDWEAMVRAFVQGSG